MDSEIKLKSYVNESVDSTVKDLKQKGLVPVVIGKGDTVESQSPTSDTIVTGQRVFIKTNGKATMPDLTGFHIVTLFALVNLSTFDLAHLKMVML